MNTLLTLGYAWLCTYLMPWFIAADAIDLSNSIFSLLFFIALFLFLRYAKKCRFCKRMQIFSYMPALLFSVMTAFGSNISTRATIHYTSVRMWLAILAYTYIYALLLRMLWAFFERAEVRLSKSIRKEKNAVLRVFEILMRRPVLLALLLLVCWLPCYISTFPGHFFYDAAREFNQSVTGYSGDFPMLHSVLIINVMKLGFKLTGSYNTGIAVYVIAQMILLSSLFTYIVKTLSRLGKNAKLLVGVTAFFALFPFIHVLAASTVRDVLFSGLFTFTVFLIYLMVGDRRTFFSSIKQPILLGVGVTLTILSRNNNIGIVSYLVIGGGCIAILLLAGKKHLKSSVCFCASAILSYALIGAALTQLCQPLTPSPIRSSISLLTQSIARSYTYESDKWTEDELAEFRTFFDMEHFGYVPENADGTKNTMYLKDEDFGRFLSLWLRIGKKTPGCYMDAVMANTWQMWYPGAVPDGYVERGTADPSYEKSFFYFDEIEAPAVHARALERVRAFYESLGTRLSYEKLPVVSMLFSCGFVLWTVLCCLFYVWYRRCYDLLIPLSVILFYALMTAFLPLVQLRYSAVLFFTFPLVAVFSLQPSVRKDISV